MSFTPRQSKRLIAAFAAVIAVLVTVVVIAALRAPAPKPSAPSATTSTAGFNGEGEAPLTAADLDQIAAEKVVKAFYDSLNHGDLAAARAQVATQTAGQITAKAFKDWKYTAFMLTRSIIGTETAQIFGAETRKALSGDFPGLRVSLRRSGDAWRITKWSGVGQTVLKGATPKSSQYAGPIALNETNARDVLSTLLQARQVGDVISIRLVTTPGFQAMHPYWMSGSDNTATFTKFVFGTATVKRDSVTVPVAETWFRTKKHYTYTLIRDGENLFVDSSTAP